MRIRVRVRVRIRMLLPNPLPTCRRHCAIDAISNFIILV